MPHLKVAVELEKTMSVKPGDPFYSPNAETTPNDLVMLRKRDSARTKFIKEVLPDLVEKISTKDSASTLETLKLELGSLLILFMEIFESRNSLEMSILRNSLKKLTFQGKARILKTINDCKEIIDERKNEMKKMILEETKK